MYLLSEVREVTSCSTSEPARSLVMRTTAPPPAPPHRRVQILSALIGSLHGKDGMGSKRVWRRSILPCNPTAIAGGCRMSLGLIPMQMLGFICCY